MLGGGIVLKNGLVQVLKHEVGVTLYLYECGMPALPAMSDGGGAFGAEVAYPQRRAQTREHFNLFKVTVVVRVELELDEIATGMSERRSVLFVLLKVTPRSRVHHPPKGCVEGVKDPATVRPCLDAIPYPRGGSVDKTVLDETVGSAGFEHYQALSVCVRIHPDSHGAHAIKCVGHGSDEIGVSREVEELGPTLLMGKDREGVRVSE